MQSRHAAPGRVDRDGRAGPGRAGRGRDTGRGRDAGPVTPAVWGYFICYFIYDFVLVFSVFLFSCSINNVCGDGGGGAGDGGGGGGRAGQRWTGRC